MTDLNEFFKLVSEEKKKTKKELDNLISDSFDELFVKPLEESALPKKKNTSQLNKNIEISEVIEEKTSFGTPTLIQKSLGLLAEPIKTNNSDPLTPLNQNFATLEDLQKHYKIFIDRVQQQLSTLGGGGEVRLEFLDDVNRNSVKVDNHYLKFDGTTGKFVGSAISTSQSLDQTLSVGNTSTLGMSVGVVTATNYFGDGSNLVGVVTSIEAGIGISVSQSTGAVVIGSILVDDDYTTQIDNNVVSVINLPNAVIGPVQGFQFDTTHEHTTKTPGTLCWNAEDDTLNIQHTNDVIQQVGQELYLRARNETGSTILNGTTVRFAGASNGDGEPRITAAPFLANGTFPALYTIGVATQDIEDDEEGFITVFGKVRDLNTTGVGVTETWAVGDILYANPSVAGALTKVKPTAPNNVVPIAAVVKVDATEGEIFVRPTIEQKYSYGLFSRTTDLAVAGINTAYVVNFDTTNVSNGVGIGTTSSKLVVDQSGLYKIDISAQIDSSSGGLQGATMYMWIRKNGNDVNDSTRRQGVVGAAPSTNMSFSVNINLNANDNIEIAYAGDNTALIFDASSANAFAPSTAAVKVTVTQEVL